jgi:hypothetical protein
MKERMQDYALTEDELAAIRTISDQRRLSVGELAKNLHASKGLASRVVKSLEDKGIFETKKEGIKKTAEISRANFAMYLSEMMRAEPYVPWEKVLSYSNMSVLLASITGERDFERGLSSSTKWRAVRNLSMHGLIPPANEASMSNAINPRIGLFVREYANHIGRYIGQKLLPPNAVVMWQKGQSYLFKVGKNKPGQRGEGGRIPTSQLHKTALSAYPSYGLKFITDEVYYYFEPGKRKLSLEEVVLHTLLIDPRSQTYMTYALLLIYKEKAQIDLKLLTELSSRYGLTLNVAGIVKYIESEGKIRAWPHPKWEELMEQARVYGIRLTNAKK